VQAVIGPGQISKRVEPLQELGNAVLASEGNIGAVKQLGRLGRNLSVAAGGVAELRDGISEASNGAGLLALGSDRAGEGAELIAAGLGRAAGGSGRAIAALEQFASGSKRLAEAVERATLGTIEARLAIGQSLLPTFRANTKRRSRNLQAELEKETNQTLPKLIGPAKEAEAQLKVALAQLEAMTIGKTDPNYAATLEAVRRASAAVTGTDPVSGEPFAAGYGGLVPELEALQKRLKTDASEADTLADFIASTIRGLEKADRGLKALVEGMHRIEAGSNQLAQGAARFSKTANTLAVSLARLAGGATALVGGIDRLGGGAEALEGALARGAEEVAPLQGGLQRASVQVLAGKRRINRQARRVRDASPGLFNSGYFVLSAIDGAPPDVRERVGGTIDLPHGGQAASILVISRYPFNSQGSIALNKRLDKDAERLGKQAGLETGLAGGAAQLNDYSKVTRERIPWVIAAITFVTFLVLVVVLRAILLAAIAVGLNLLTVGVAFGILTLLFNVPEDWPLGGHNYVDAVGATMIFGVVFGLSIDYAVFLLSRMREHYDRHGNNEAAIRFGLEKTARVITGAAAIMLAVFIVFAGAPIATVSQLGIGLTVAVILDATVVRIVLLPALMLLIGERVWWLPKPLARVLPKLSV
jgi:RND superfamily putative drug exporter